MVHGRIIPFYVVMLLLSVAAAETQSKEKLSKKPDQTGELKGLLLASMQNTISLTEVVAQQTQKMGDVVISLKEAKLEIEQLKMKLSSYDSTTTGLIEDLRTELNSEFSQQIEDQTSKCTQQIEDQTSKCTQQIEDLTQEIEAQNTTFSQQIEAQNTTISQQIEDQTSKSTQQIEDLTTGLSQQIEALDDKLAGSENNTTTKLDELREEAARAENSTTEKIEDMKYNVSVVTSELEDLVSKVSAVEDVAGTWPTGAYCILGSGGSCPTGFTRHEGYVHAIYAHSASSGWLKQATFGDSRVACYHSSCSNSYNSKANIYITACCK